MNQKRFNYLTWTVVSGSLALSIFVWGDSVNWKIAGLSVYQWFPLFGLIAWTTMTTHFYTGSLRILYKDLKRPKWFSEITGNLVLGSLLLHPGLLTYAQIKNDQGTPPGSYYSYVGNSLKLAVILGTIALLIFLSFEVFERIKNNATIKKYWWAVSLSQSLAMTLIWVHGLRLGTHLGDGWFRVVWVLYGLALIPSFYIIHKNDFTVKP